MVKMVEDELKIDVKEDISAAIMTASISPRSPAGIFSLTNIMNAIFVQPDLLKR